MQECEFNPKRPVPCELGCGLVVPKDELKVSKNWLCSVTEVYQLMLALQTFRNTIAFGNFDP